MGLLDLNLRFLLMKLVPHPEGVPHLRHAHLRFPGFTHITSADMVFWTHSQVLHTALSTPSAARPPQSAAYLAAVLQNRSQGCTEEERRSEKATLSQGFGRV